MLDKDFSFVLGARDPEMREMAAQVLARAGRPRRGYAGAYLA